MPGGEQSRRWLVDCKSLLIQRGSVISGLGDPGDNFFPGHLVGCRVGNENRDRQQSSTRQTYQPDIVGCGSYAVLDIGGAALMGHNRSAW